MHALSQVLHSRGDPAGAIVSVDPATGAIRAMAAVTPGTRGNEFNLVTTAERQPGSTFKPIVLAAAGLRVALDDRNEKVNLKIREAQLQKIPYMLVVGDREAQSDSVSVRNRKHGDQGAQTVENFLGEIRKLIDTKARTE